MGFEADSALADVSNSASCARLSGAEHTVAWSVNVCDCL